MGCFELKGLCFATKKGVTFKRENKDGYHFFSGSEGAGGRSFYILPSSGELASSPTIGHDLQVYNLQI